MRKFAAVSNSLRRQSIFRPFLIHALSIELFKAYTSFYILVEWMPLTKARRLTLVVSKGLLLLTLRCGPTNQSCWNINRLWSWQSITPAALSTTSIYFGDRYWNLIMLSKLLQRSSSNLRRFIDIFYISLYIYLFTNIYIYILAS